MNSLEFNFEYQVYNTTKLTYSGQIRTSYYLYNTVSNWCAVQCRHVTFLASCSAHPCLEMSVTHSPVKR